MNFVQKLKIIFLSSVTLTPGTYLQNLCPLVCPLDLYFYICPGDSYPVEATVFLIGFFLCPPKQNGNGFDGHLVYVQGASTTTGFGDP